MTRDKVQVTELVLFVVFSPLLKNLQTIKGQVQRLAVLWDILRVLNFTLWGLTKDFLLNQTVVKFLCTLILPRPPPQPLSGLHGSILAKLMLRILFRKSPLPWLTLQRILLILNSLSLE